MGLDNPLHILFIVLILLLLFGARRLPEIGRSLGTGMREFKQSITGEEHHNHAQASPTLAAGAPAAQQPAQPTAPQPAAPPAAPPGPPPPTQGEATTAPAPESAPAAPERSGATPAS
jgi:sec-independent protein translocase protein TatA